MKDLIKNHKNEIIVGIVVFFITTIISHIGNWILHTAPSAGNTILSKMNDFIYYCASRQSSYSLLILLFASVFGIFVIFSIATIIKGFHTINEVREVENTLNILNEISGNEQVSETSKKKLNHVVEQRKRLAKKEESKPKKLRIIMVLQLVFVILYTGYLLLYILLPSMLWQSFEISIIQISPYVDEYDVKQLQSQWVSMDSHEDYKVIDNYISEIKREYDLDR